MKDLSTDTTHTPPLFSFYTTFKNLAFFFLFPSKQFLPISSQFSCEKLLPKTKRTMLRRQWLCEYWYISGTTIQFIFCQVRLINVVSLVSIMTHPPHTVCTHWAGIFGRKVQLGPANRRQKLGLVWRNRKKISQIINDCLCLPFFLLIILWIYSYKRVDFTGEGGGTPKRRCRAGGPLSAWRTRRRTRRRSRTSSASSDHHGYRTREKGRGEWRSGGPALPF